MYAYIYTRYNELNIRKHCMNTDPKSTIDNQNYKLEPRVAKLEVGLDRLTEDVRDLAGVVRTQGQVVEQEIQKLIVAVTQASGPRKTDWGTIISALFLIMAIGSAVFWPLNQTSQDNKDSLKALHAEFIEHKNLMMHPVGAARVVYMEQKFNELSSNNRDAIESLDKKLSRETELITSEIRNQINTISGKYDREISDLGDRLLSRLNGYDQSQMDLTRRDLEELRLWRMRAMNGDVKGITPLIITPDPIPVPSVPIPNAKIK